MGNRIVLLEKNWVPCPWLYSLARMIVGRGWRAERVDDSALVIKFWDSILSRVDLTSVSTSTFGYGSSRRAHYGFWHIVGAQYFLEQITGCVSESDCCILCPPFLEIMDKWLCWNLNRLWWKEWRSAGFFAHRIIHFLLFLGRTLGLGFHTVVCGMDWETANLGFFIYQTKQTQTFDLMDGIPKWMISLSFLNSAARPLASCRLSLGGGQGRSSGGCNGKISRVKD